MISLWCLGSIASYPASSAVFIFNYLCIHFLFLVVPGLCCCAWAFSSCVSGGYSWQHTGFSLPWHLLSWSICSRSAGYGSSVVLGLSCSMVPGIFWTRDWTCAPCIGRWILNHCTPREVLLCFKLLTWKWKLTLFHLITWLACPCG